MDMEKWCRQKSGEARQLSDKRLLKYFMHKQPQIVLASVYTLAKAEKRPFNSRDIAKRTAVPYSTVRAILIVFEDFGIVKQVESTGLATSFKASIYEVEKVIRAISKIE